MSTGIVTDMKWPVALGFDVVAVIIFGVLGRAAHTEALTAAGIFSTTWPFVVGLAVGWLVWRMWQVPDAWPRSIGLVAVTVALGHVVRVWVAQDTTHWTFVVVSLLVLAVLMVGWRLVMQFVRPHQDVSPDAAHKY